MFPLSDDSPRRVTPIVTWFIIGACVLVFLWQSSLGAKAGEITLYQYGMIPARLFGLAIAFELQFEPGFTEAYEWIHSASAQEELDSLCREARMLRYVDRHGPKAA